MSVVLQCPVCSASFQVAPEQAGQLVACPTCDQTVAVPANIQAPTPEPAPAKQEVFACPSCRGKFGVTAEMKGTEVACPHCDTHVAIDSSSSGSSDTVASGQNADANPIRIRTGKKKKKTVIDIPGASTKNTEDIAAKPDDMLPPKIGRFKSKSNPPVPIPDVTKRGKSKTRSKSESKKTPQVPTQTTTKPKERVPVQPKAKTDSEARAKPQRPPAKEPKPTSDAKAKPTPPPKQSNQPVVEPATVGDQLADPIDRRLPPKFTAVDPEEQLSVTTREHEHKVILPDGEGGYQRLDSRVVHVERDGRKVQLYSAPKEKKERKRFLQNLIAILIGIVVLAAAFYFLVSW